MYQDKFRPTPKWSQLVKPFTYRFPFKPGISIRILYSKGCSEITVRHQWYNWLWHHHKGQYKINAERYTEGFILIITRVDEPNPELL